MAEEKTLSSQLIYGGRAVKLRVDTVQMASGRKTTREIVEHSDCVAIIALDDNNDVLLVNQFRKPVEKELLEIPAGGIDPGEDAETTVRRRLTGLIVFFPRPSLAYTVVLPSTTVVELNISTAHQAVLSIDGHINLPLSDGASIRIKLSPYKTRFLRIHPETSFYSSLEQKLKGKR